MSENNSIRNLGRILVEGELVLESPLIIGTGGGTESDNDILRDGQGRPYIPGTSWAGAVREYLTPLRDKRKYFERFFGTEKGKPSSTYQSALITNDLFRKSGAEDNPTEFRENVHINPVTGTAQEGALFDYEVIRAGETFNFSFEVIVRGAMQEKPDLLNAFDIWAKLIIYYLQSGRIRLGAKTNSGYGKVSLRNPRYRLFDFGKKDDVHAWFSGRYELNPIVLTDQEYDIIENDDVLITGRFQLQDALMIRQNVQDREKVDSRHFLSGKHSLIPGTSLKGVLRQRATKILKTLIPADTAEEKIKDLFGYVSTEKESDAKAVKGRIQVGESIVQGGKRYVQTRIKVDCFTGSVLEHALLQEEPLWDDGNTYFDLEILIRKPRKEDLGLILQVLKDLWTGDLAIGGESSIGRGRFKGKAITIAENHQRYSIQADGDKVSFSNKENFTTIEEAWQKYIGQEVKNV